MLSVDEALQRILADAALQTLQQGRVEFAGLLDLGGRVLLQDQTAAVDVPPWDNSAMDGYALQTQDLATSATLPVSQVIPAGLYPQPLQKCTVARIFTGAPVPAGADAVEMQENTCNEAGNITFLQPVKTGANIRKRGEDIALGAVVVKAGTVLKPAHSGLLASVGIRQVPVSKPLRVAVLSTGDELAEPGEILKEGQIYNSNRYLLITLLRELGCDVIDAGRIGDDRELTQQTLARWAKDVDVMVSSGGVSVGEEDHVKAAVESIGELGLWKIAVKPGKPLAFGHIGACTFFGLPGNPVSAFVTFILFVRPYVLKAQGATELQPQRIDAIAGFDWPPVKPGKERKPVTREEYLRVRLQADGKTLELFPNQSSGALSSVVWANGLAIAPVGALISRGDRVKFIPT